MIEVLEYYVNLDERGEFYADIRNKKGETLVEIDTEYAQFLTDERIRLDNMTDIWNYFRTIEMIPYNSILIRGN